MRHCRAVGDRSPSVRGSAPRPQKSAARHIRPRSAQSGTPSRKPQPPCSSCARCDTSTATRQANSLAMAASRPASACPGVHGARRSMAELARRLGAQPHPAKLVGGALKLADRPGRTAAAAARTARPPAGWPAQGRWPDRQSASARLQTGHLVIKAATGLPHQPVTGHEPALELQREEYVPDNLACGRPCRSAVRHPAASGRSRARGSPASRR